MTPNVEESLAAAAFTILTDDYRHSASALTWARNFLASANGMGTAFWRGLGARKTREFPRNPRFARKCGAGVSA